MSRAQWAVAVIGFIFVGATAVVGVVRQEQHYKAALTTKDAMFLAGQNHNLYGKIIQLQAEIKRLHGTDLENLAMEAEACEDSDLMTDLLDEAYWIGWNESQLARCDEQPGDPPYAEWEEPGC